MRQQAAPSQALLIAHNHATCGPAFACFDRGRAWPAAPDPAYTTPCTAAAMRTSSPSAFLSIIKACLYHLSN